MHSCVTVQYYRSNDLGTQKAPWSPAAPLERFPGPPPHSSTWLVYRSVIQHTPHPLTPFTTHPSQPSPLTPHSSPLTTHPLPLTPYPFLTLSVAADSRTIEKVHLFQSPTLTACQWSHKLSCFPHDLDGRNTISALCMHVWPRTRDRVATTPHRFTVQYTVHTAQSTLHSPHHMIHTTQSTPYSTVHTTQSTIHTAPYHPNPTPHHSTPLHTCLGMATLEAGAIVSTERVTGLCFKSICYCTVDRCAWYLFPFLWLQSLVFAFAPHPHHPTSTLLFRFSTSTSYAAT